MLPQLKPLVTEHQWQKITWAELCRAFPSDFCPQTDALAFHLKKVLLDVPVEGKPQEYLEAVMDALHREAERLERSKLLVKALRFDVRTWPQL